MVFWNQIKDTLLSAINYAYSVGHLHSSALKGIISLIPKKGRDTRKVENMHPITLLNMDYKLIEKVLANRLKPVLIDIINANQRGFLTDRHIACNIRRIFDLIEYAQEENIPGVILSMDFEKCFDRVETAALLKALRYFGAEESFLKWMQVLYTDPIAAVANNGFLSSWFRVTRSIKQGGPNSAYYFLVIAEVLAIELRKKSRD